MEKKVVRINESQLRQMIAESVEQVLGYDMSTPEGREGARKWMNSMMFQEDPVETVAHNWAYENGLDGDENVIKAFTAGVEYGRNN